MKEVSQKQAQESLQKKPVQTGCHPLPDPATAPSPQDPAPKPDPNKIIAYQAIVKANAILNEALINIIAMSDA